MANEGIRPLGQSQKPFATEANGCADLFGQCADLLGGFPEPIADFSDILQNTMATKKGGTHKYSTRKNPFSPSYLPIGPLSTSFHIGGGGIEELIVLEVDSRFYVNQFESLSRKMRQTLTLWCFWRLIKCLARVGDEWKRWGNSMRRGYNGVTRVCAFYSIWAMAKRQLEK